MLISEEVLKGDGEEGRWYIGGPLPFEIQIDSKFHFFRLHLFFCFSEARVKS